MHRYVRIGEEGEPKRATVVLERAGRGGARSSTAATACLGAPPSGLAGPYSATVASIPTKPATPIHRSRPSDGLTAISRPRMSHRIVIIMLNPKSGNLIAGSSLVWKLDQPRRADPAGCFRAGRLLRVGRAPQFKRGGARLAFRINDPGSF